MPHVRFFGALRDLRIEDAEFILVGGLAAILNGAPVQTLDLDVVYSRAPANLEHLGSFLAQADAIFRIQPERRLRPAASHLAGTGQLNLLTKYGPIDLLGSIGNGLTYAELLPHAKEMEIGEGVRIQVLDLETIIAIKEQLGTEKDRAMLPLLRQTLRESRKP